MLSFILRKATGAPRLRNQCVNEEEKQTKFLLEIFFPRQEDLGKYSKQTDCDIPGNEVSSTGQI